MAANHSRRDAYGTSSFITFSLEGFSFSVLHIADHLIGKSKRMVYQCFSA